MKIKIPGDKAVKGYPKWRTSVSVPGGGGAVEALASSGVFLYDTFSGTWPTPDRTGGLWLGMGNASIAAGVLTLTPVAGVDLWDAAAAVFTAGGPPGGAGTYGWTTSGTNTIENEANSLKVTYGDWSTGASVVLRDSIDLSADLVVNKYYRLSVDAKVNAGSAVGLACKDGVSVPVFVYVTDTNFTTYSYVFRALSATACEYRFSGMGAGEIVWTDNLSLKPLPISSLITNQQLITTDVLAEAVISAYPGTAAAQGTQVGMVLNADRSFAAKCAATAAAGQAVISLKEVTGVAGAGLAVTDGITIKHAGGDVVYTIASVAGGANVAYDDTTKTQTITLGTNLAEEVAVDSKVGLDWAAWNGCLFYFDGAGKFQADEVKAGVYTNRNGGGVTQAFAADKITSVSKVGSAYNIKFDGAAVGTEITTFDAAAMAGKYVGLFSTSALNTITSFKVTKT